MSLCIFKTTLEQWALCMLCPAGAGRSALQQCRFQQLLLHAQVMAQYGNAELVWCQEEPKNMGAWSYIRPRLGTAMRELGASAGMRQRPLSYVGRTSSASVGEACCSATMDLAPHTHLPDTIERAVTNFPPYPSCFTASCSVWVCMRAATASMAIHRLETKQIIDSVLSSEPITDHQKI